MNQDVTPSMTETPHEPTGFPAAGAARSGLETPPDTDFDALTDLFIGNAAMSPHGASADGSTSTVLRFAPDDGPHLVANEPVSSDSLSDGIASLCEVDQTRVTALVLGHLPVFASAWANQYARHLAENSGGVVAVLRIRGGYAAVDLVGTDLPELEASDTIERAIELAGRVTNQWVLRVGEPDEPMLASCDAVDELTLLTGIDEAAVVASYQTLKRFGQRGEARPEITLAVMAANEEQAKPIAHKISRATETFLERPARVICCIEKITGGPSAHVFGGDSTITLETALDLVRAAGDGLSEVVEATSEPIIDELTSMAGVDSAFEIAQEAEPALGVAAPPQEKSQSETSATPMSEAVAALGDAAKSVAESDGLSDSPASLDAFESFLATCPYCESVRLAIDSRGSLQFIADIDATVEEQIVQLTTVSSWAKDHMVLLGLTDPRLCVESAPVQHLVTRTPASVRRLLDSEIHVHLLVDAPGGACVTVPLNHE